MIAESAGWIGSGLLLICSLPQAWKSWREGHSEGLSATMLWLWIFGMLFMIAYFIPLKAYPAIISHSFNVFVAGTITWFKHFPRSEKQVDDFLGL